MSYRFFPFRRVKRPTISDEGSFFILRPSGSYKTNCAIMLLKSDSPILYDVGSGKEVFHSIKNALTSMKKDKKDVKYAILSHFHPDHHTNIRSLKKFLPNANMICHKKAFNTLLQPFKYNTGREKIFERRSIKYSMISWNFYNRIFISKKTKYYTVENDPLFKFGNLRLKFLYTPGHNAGHLCLHDLSNKILFLGDLIPFTPWIDVYSEAVDDMIYSIQKLIDINPKLIKHSVRSHGNLSDNAKEVYEWSEERERFERYLDLIYDSLEKIPKILKNRPLKINEIASRILLNEYNSYNKFMNVFFFPPNVSWIYSYLLKLREEGKVEKKKNKWVSS
jgi:glyoxylase-like metal-dependent hydrolase (beta-lactamase superfamily II)